MDLGVPALQRTQTETLVYFLTDVKIPTETFRKCRYIKKIKYASCKCSPKGSAEISGDRVHGGMGGQPGEV